MGNTTSLKAGQLWVVRIAADLANTIRECVHRWDTFDRQTIGLQLVRSADSVGANITEGYARSHGKDALRFYSIARGSLEETIYWLRQAKNAELINEKVCIQWRRRYYILSNSMNKFANYHKKKEKGARPSSAV